MSSRLSSSSVSRNTENVDRLKSENPDKFTEIVTSHLSIFLDLGNGILAEMLEECTSDLTESKTPFSPFLRRKKPKVTNALFGNQLTHRHISRVLPLISYLQQPHNLRMEGLFRKTGNIERQRSLREVLDTQDLVEFPLNNFTTHDCAGMLKAFLSELPEPLLTAKHFNAYSQVSDLSDELKQISSLQLLVQLLPEENFRLLGHLMCLLNSVCNEPDNLMNAGNLAIIFALHLAMPKTLTIDEQRMSTNHLTRAIEVMIRNADVLFEYPTELIADVTQYLLMLDRAPGSAASVRRISNGSASTHGSTPKTRLRFPRLSKKSEKDLKEDDEEEEDNEIVISSSVVFADRKASTEAATTSNTSTALADLHSLILAMPDSSRKRKLMSRMTPSTEPESVEGLQHAVSKSIRKMFGGKRQDSKTGASTGSNLTACFSPSVHQQSPSYCVTPSVQSRAPVVRLFADTDSSKPAGHAERRRVSFAAEEESVPSTGLDTANIHAQKIFEDEYDSDDLQCSLLDKSETDDDDISYDDTSLSSNEYDESDKENSAAPVFHKNKGQKQPVKVELMSPESVKGLIKIVEGARHVTNCCSPVNNGSTPTRSVLGEMPCAVERLRGYISPLAYPYIAKDEEVGNVQKTQLKA